MHLHPLSNARKEEKTHLFFKKKPQKLVSSKISRTFAPRLRDNAHRKDVQAEIAQLVEHNLAKVGVASSSLVFRSS